MSFQQYQRAVVGAAAGSLFSPFEIRDASEAVCACLRAAYAGGGHPDPTELCELLGGVLGAVALCCEMYGLPLREVARAALEAAAEGKPLDEESP